MARATAKQMGQTTALTKQTVAQSMAPSIMQIVPARTMLGKGAPLGERPDGATEETVARILADVRQQGDAAVRDATRKFDRIEIQDFAVPRQRLTKAWESTPANLRAAMRTSARNLAKAQRSIIPKGSTVEVVPGLTLATDWIALRRIGAYAPGGRAAYPSTVLMTCIPARIAGVDEVFLASPPGADGLPNQLVLAAAHFANVDTVYAMGGAQALAAFAFGTDTIPRVDKIVGPGNRFVAEAKRQLQGAVGTDALAGPSELAVWAEPPTDPNLVALDLCAQAEHDPSVRALVVTTDAAYAEQVGRAVTQRIAALGTTERADVVRTSLSASSIAVARGLDEVAQLLDTAAPEHVQLLGPHPERLARRLRCAGTIFEGSWAPSALGDYVTGANHVLPTGGAARWSGPLSVYDFMRPRVRQRLDARASRRLAIPASVLARAEGLPNHATAVLARRGSGGTVA